MYREPTITHNYPLLAIKLILFVAAVVLVCMFVHATITAAPMDQNDCSTVKHPEICKISYSKCNTIGLNAECMALARLDGELGYDAVNGNKVPLSQNTPTGVKQ